MAHVFIPPAVTAGMRSCFSEQAGPNTEYSHDQVRQVHLVRKAEQPGDTAGRIPAITCMIKWVHIGIIFMAADLPELHKLWSDLNGYRGVGNPPRNK
jgi:hypothetical protein